MQYRCFALIAIGLAAVGISSFGADFFRNLNFDEGETSGVFQDSISGLTIGRTAELLPGWQVIVGRYSMEFLAVDPRPFDSQRISLVDYNPVPFWDVVSPDMGTLALLLAPRGTNIYDWSDTTTISLIQHGRVPAYATGLVARGTFAGIVYDWKVTMDGVRLPAVVGVEGIIVDSLADFAGKDVELRIDLSGSVRARLDQIDFVPEPSVLAMEGLGLVIALGVARASQLKKNRR